MIRLHDGGVLLRGGRPIAACAAPEGAREKTIAWKILSAHNHPAPDGQLHLSFDGLISHDITYVGIIQTARASGLTRFPLPYTLTNCHNSLCAVGGTINEDDHVFGLSAAVKYGGDYVPANQAVIHQYAREMMAGCGKMLLGSDSHTRYGALGAMGVGEGGPARSHTAWARTTPPSPCAAQPTKTALSKIRFWSSRAPACGSFPWTSASASTS